MLNLAFLLHQLPCHKIGMVTTTASQMSQYARIYTVRVAVMYESLYRPMDLNQFVISGGK